MKNDKSTSWKTSHLTDLCGNNKQNIVDGPFGSDLKRSDYISDGIPVLKIQNIKEEGINLKNIDYISGKKFNELKRHSFLPGDIIMTKLGDPLGICAIVKDIEHGVVVADLVRIRPIDINTEYLNYYLNSPKTRQYINSKQKGTTRPRVKLSIVRSLPISHPKEKQEQQKIVDKIKQLFSIFDNNTLSLRNTKKNLLNLRRKLLESVFAGSLTQNFHDDDFNFESSINKIRDSRKKLYSDFKGKSKYKNPKKPRDKTFPDRWKTLSMEEFGLVETGATPLRGNKEYWDGGDVPWVTSTVVNRQKVSEPSELITQKALDETNTKLFPKETLLVAMYGEGKTRGKVTELMIEAATNQALAGIILSEEAKKYKEFIKLYLYKNYEDLRRLASGGVQPNLNLTLIKQMPIPYPSVKEQEAIIDLLTRYLSIIDKSLEQIDYVLSLADKTKQSILKKAFEGKLV